MTIPHQNEPVLIIEYRNVLPFIFGQVGRDRHPFQKMKKPWQDPSFRSTLTARAPLCSLYLISQARSTPFQWSRSGIRGNYTNPFAPRHGKHILPAHLPGYAGHGSRFYQSQNQEYRPGRQSSRRLRRD